MRGVILRNDASVGCGFEATQNKCYIYIYIFVKLESQEAAGRYHSSFSQAACWWER